MSNPNPGSSGGGIGPALSEHAEAPSDADWDAAVNPANPFDGKGMTPDDAAETAFNDWDAKAHGIAESARKPVGQWLQGHADAAGTTIETGLQSLVNTAAVLRNGNQPEKREMLGHLIDEYNVRGVPGVEEAAPQFDEFGDPVGQHPQQALTEDQAAASSVSQFVADNPICEDPAIAKTMIDVAADMRGKVCGRTYLRC